jgi:hypothetical protein
MRGARRTLTEFFSWVNATWRNTIRVRFVSDLPDQLLSQTLYVIGEGTPWSGAMVCPCGCDSLIHLSLLKDDSPRWTVEISFFGLPTLAPSVWRTRECRAHFFLRGGRILWCGPH